MHYLQTDFFSYPFQQQFAGIITDVPYKGCLTNKLQEQDFDVAWFLKKCDQITPKDSFLITFSNMAMILDMRMYAKDTNWEFQNGHGFVIRNSMQNMSNPRINPNYLNPTIPKARVAPKKRGMNSF